MTHGHNLPLSETLGVFVGVAGFDWLTEGQAEPLKALAFAVAAGALLLVGRLLLQRRSKD